MHLAWFLCLVSFTLASNRINSFDESSAEELVPMAESSGTLGPHSAWSNISLILRDNLGIRSTNDQAALSCQQATVEAIKAGAAITSLFLMLHLKTSFDKLCSKDMEVIMLMLVSMFGLGMIETLVSIIGVCTNCAQRVNAPDSTELSATRIRLRRGIDTAGVLGILLGVIKTGGLMNYLSSNVDVPLCANKSSDNLFESDIILVILFTSLIQIASVIASFGMAFIHDRHS